MKDSIVANTPLVHESITITLSIRSLQRYTLGCIVLLLFSLYWSPPGPPSFEEFSKTNVITTCTELNHPTTLEKPGLPKRDEWTTGTMSRVGNSSIPIQHFQASTRRHELQSGAITVILTGFKRSAAQLRAQIHALLNSTLVPHEIIFYQNGDHVNFRSVLTEYPMIKHIHNVNHNTRFHGRFTVALLATTEYVFDEWTYSDIIFRDIIFRDIPNDSRYVAVVDDEPICGPRWLQYAIEHVDREHAIVGTAGRRVQKSIRNAMLAHVYGHPIVGGTPAGMDEGMGTGVNLVDFVGHWWIWRTEWTSAMFSTPSSNLWTGEDIEFCAKLRMFLGVRALTLNVPDGRYVSEYPEQKVQLGNDEHASSKVEGTVEERISVIQYWISRGWVPLAFQS